MMGSLAVGLLLIVVAGLAVVVAVVMLVIWQVTKRQEPLSYGEPSPLPQDSLAD